MTEHDRDNPNTYTIPKVIERICRLDGCDAATAKDELRAALEAGIGPLYWLDRVVPPRQIDGPLDAPTSPSVHWSTADIDFSGGTVLEFGLPDGRSPRRRVMLLHRAAVEGRWPDLASIVAAEADRRRTDAKRDFCDHWWPTGRVLCWLAWRDPDSINDDWLPELRYKSGTAFKGNPRPGLLRAVQAGELKAYRSDRPMQPMQPVAWARVEAHRLPDADFQKEDVLRVWPKGSDTAAERVAKKRGMHPVEMLRVATEMRRKIKAGELDLNAEKLDALAAMFKTSISTARRAKIHVSRNSGFET